MHPCLYQFCEVYHQLNAVFIKSTQGQLETRTASLQMVIFYCRHHLLLKKDDQYSNPGFHRDVYHSLDACIENRAREKAANKQLTRLFTDISLFLILMLFNFRCIHSHNPHNHLLKIPGEIATCCDLQCDCGCGSIVCACR